MKYDIDIKSNKDAVLSELQESAAVALEAVGLKAEGYAKLELENHPRRIDTGRLRNSITHTEARQEGGESVVYVGTNVEYATYVHEGTVRMIPNRFLKNAIDRNKSEYKAILESYLSN